MVTSWIVAFWPSGCMLVFLVVFNPYELTDFQESVVLLVPGVAQGQLSITGGTVQ